MSDATITPKHDYMLCKEVREATGAMTTTEVADHWQKYEVLAVGRGRYIGEQDKWVEPEIKVGEIIWVIKHAEADTPPELKSKGLALIQSIRVMATEVKNG